MKVAAFQFHGSDDVKENLLAIERGMEKGSKVGVRFLITQECAICGYPSSFAYLLSLFELLMTAVIVIIFKDAIPK